MEDNNLQEKVNTLTKAIDEIPKGQVDGAIIAITYVNGEGHVKIKGEVGELACILAAAIDTYPDFEMAIKWAIGMFRDIRKSSADDMPAINEITHQQSR
jgi:hypothetical protein